MHRYLIVSMLLLGCIVGAFTQTSVAQSLASIDEHLVQRADFVVVGRVTEMRSSWNRDRTGIVTSVSLAVDEFLKGQGSQRSLVVSVPGGEVDGVGEMYTHMPKFTVNEAVLLFLQRADGGALRVVGGEAGKIAITEDRLTGKKVVGENQLLEVFTTRIKSAIKHQEQK
ncbi:MAG TPA: hypothetical protein VNL69_02295 [Bacteroidota bacterium]|nr:hypothetical protein [Bacteroidota bacterium]